MEKDRELVTDEELVALFLARKEEAIHLAEKKYGKYILSTVRNILGDEEDSRECVNDVLFLLWTHIPPDRPKCFKAYISRVARNLAINRAKAEGRQKRVPSEYVSSLDELSEYLEDPSNVERQIDDKLLRDLLDRFVRSLGEKKRRIFVCRYYYSDSVEDIAATWGLTERAVFKALAAMKRQLGEMLRKEGF